MRLCAARRLPVAAQTRHRPARQRAGWLHPWLCLLLLLLTGTSRAEDLLASQEVFFDPQGSLSIDDEVSGIGLLTASALKSPAGKPERFASGRHLSAWLGMTPREFSSGDRRKLGHISRQGNVYVRTLLIHGARAALLAATPDKLTQLQRWAVKTAARIGHNKAAVALANKLVRICWAVWCHERRLSGDWQSVRPA